MSVIIAPIAKSLSEFLASNSYSNIVVLVDQHTKRYCYPLIKSTLPKHQLIIIKSGEQEKNLITCEKIWSAMTQAELDRLCQYL
jgi:3-dehydroquinate synthase